MGTVPKILLENARRYGDASVAMREKAFGIWQDVTWARQASEVRSFAMGLASLGFGRGDKLAVIGDNRPRLYQGFMAAQCVGGVPVALYQDAIAEEVRYAVAHSEATIVLAEDQEQVDKLLALMPQLPCLRHVVYGDPKGMRAYDDPMLVSFDDVQERGRRFDAEHPGFFEVQVEAGEPDDVSVICYTAGTTGTPKAVLLSYRNLFAAGDSLLAREPWREGEEETLAYLPLAWVGEAFVSVFMAVRHGMTVNIPESPETVQRDLRELGPTVFFAPPRIWENMLRDVQVRIEDTTRLKRWLYRRAMRAALDIESLRMEREAVSFGRRLQHRIHEVLVYGPLRDQLGLRRVRHAYAGGAAMGPDTLRNFRGIGVNLKQYYGLTECSALAVVQPDTDARADSVGTPLPGVEVRIAEGGEVLLRSGGVFQGYYKDPAATAEALVDDGWLRTGDTGYLDEDGHLVIVDRADDISHLRDGTDFAPAPIENKLKFSPYIREVVAIGAGRPYVTAMVNFDLGSVGRWAARRELNFTSYSDLARMGVVYDLLEGEVRKVNEGLPEQLAIKKFLLLHKELDPDDEEVTRARSLRRWVIGERYAPLVRALYEEGETALVSSEVTHEDGRRGRTEAKVHVRQVESVPVTEAAVVGGAG
ncbi:MAG: AMP-binding protein [Acidimicrobiia bacterium]|nr:AMP-binding protein [Acidimicrobiia bacterium]